MNYDGGGMDDFVGLGDLGVVSAAVAARRCTNAQTAYSKRLATFQKQLSKAKTQAAATRIQTNMQRAMATLATKAQTACAAGPLIPAPNNPFGCPAGYQQDPVSGQCVPYNTGAGVPPTYPGSYVGQIVGGFSWNGYSWAQTGQTFPLAYPQVGVGPPNYAGSYVGQVVGYYTWNGYSWTQQSQVAGAAPTFPGTYANEVVNGYIWNGYQWISQSSGAAPLTMPPWLQPGGGFGPTPVSNYYPQPYYSGGGPLLTPISEADQYTGAMYSPGYAQQPVYAMQPSGGPVLTPIDPSDVSMDMPGYTTQAEDMQPNSQAPGFPPSGTGPTQTNQQCSMEASNPATSDAYGPLQTIQIVCGAAAAAAPSQSPTYNGQTITSVEESEIGMMGLGRYLG
jgi:hypothetical protein